MSEYFEAGLLNILDKTTDTYHKMLAIKGDKGDPGPVASEEEIRRVTSEEVAKVVAEAPEDFDTLKEIADWIATHQDDAAAMNSAIQTNAAGVAQNRQSISDLSNTVSIGSQQLNASINAINEKLTQVHSMTLSAGETELNFSVAGLTASSVINPYFWAADGETLEPVSFNAIRVTSAGIHMEFDALDHDIVVGVTVY